MPDYPPVILGLTSNSIADSRIVHPRLRIFVTLTKTLQIEFEPV